MIILVINSSDLFVFIVYNNLVIIFGVGFIFVVLIGIYFKEVFCFNCLEIKLFIFLVFFLFLFYMIGFLLIEIKEFLLGIWVFLFIIFVI